MAWSWLTFAWIGAIMPDSINGFPLYNRRRFDQDYEDK